MSSMTESTPLLAEEVEDPPMSFSVLVELIGARNLPVSDLETYCLVHYGLKRVHRTKPYSPIQASRVSKALRMFGGNSKNARQNRQLRDPIWTVEENALFSIIVTQNDLENKKSLKITVWGRSPLQTKRNPQCLGSIRIRCSTILEQCTTADRLEEQLTNDLGHPIVGEREEPTLLAFRCRMATVSDLNFVDHWEQTPRPKNWDDTGIIPAPYLERAKLITDQPENALQQSITFRKGLPALPSGHIRVKPYPDPGVEPSKRQSSMTPQDLKAHTHLPSKKWIQVGSKTSASLGRLFVEILSAHGLPNVDIGGTVGNETNAFVAAVYGDAMAQTDTIFDELSPHWPCWSQRAFVFHIQHPSHVLYLAVFGFKRSPLYHHPIGRIELNPINFRSNGNMVYNLEYNLNQSSHATARISQGTLRIRLRVELDDERKALLCALKPSPPIYINTARKKSMRVARYAACGEYDNMNRFSLSVLQGYIDEILEGFLRRIIYSLQDGLQSLVLWREQVRIFGVPFPLYSLLAFTMGMLFVERPQLIPAILCFACVLILLEQMQMRLATPSPWRRCLSFSHYLRVLILGAGHIPTETSFILPNQGAAQQEAIEEEFRRRVAQDKEFIEKKEAVERHIEEIENFKVQTDSQNFIPMELLVVLGKVQNIVGDFCRICRLCDSIITWEESDLAFWTTLGFFLLGIICIFIPWGFLFKWTGRIGVVLLLGPQNKILDWMLFQKIPSAEQRLHMIVAARLFDARVRQEEAGKLKSFRQFLFGKYATWIPPIFWTPHKDVPTAHSTACSCPKDKLPDDVESLPCLPGQQLYGFMIPRPFGEWERNEKESSRLRDSALAACRAWFKRQKQQEARAAKESCQTFPLDDGLPRGPLQSFVEEGVEIADLYDEEQGLANSVWNLFRPSFDGGISLQESEPCQSFVDEGLEISDLYDEEQGFVDSIMSSIWSPSGEESNGGSKKLPSNDDEDSSSDEEEEGLVIPAAAVPVSISEEARKDQQSTIELGFEMAMEVTEAAMETFGGLSAPPTNEEINVDVDAPVRPPPALLRNEIWGEGDPVSPIDNDALLSFPYPLVPRVPTIIDAKYDSKDQEEGFEIIE